MKKILFSVFAIASMLFATSCSQEDDFAPVADGTEVAVSFSLTQPEISTRAYSEGIQATNLTYAVYETGSQTALIYSGEEGREKVTFTNKKANLTLNLVKGKSYDILFWADADNAPYTFDPAAQTITVDYANATCNDESRDAFFAAVKGLEITGISSQPVELKRPFAQLNLGATDTDAAADIDFVATQTKVKVKSYKTLNLLSGEVSDEDNVTFASAAIPGVDEVFPATGVTAQYLAMNYLLVNAKEIVDVEFTVRNGNDNDSHAFTNTYSNVPVQRNYRTNIYGSLLTNATDFTIEIVPGYTTPSYEVSIWDGESATIFTEEQLAAPEIKINSAADLAGIRNAINENVTTFEGKTIKLAADIDLNNMEWTPIAYSYAFTGIFDGDGHTISNLNTKDTDRGDRDNASAGLFSTMNSDVAVIKNVTVAGAKVTSNKYAGVICGYASGNKGPASIINCHVSDATVHGVNSVGGIIGLFGAIKAGAATVEDYGRLEGCTVTNTTVIGDKRVGGLAGRVYGNGQVIKDCAVENITIKSHTEGATIDGFGSFIGVLDSTSKFILEGTNTVDGQVITVDNLNK